MSTKCLDACEFESQKTGYESIDTLHEKFEGEFPHIMLGTGTGTGQFL
jgi:hypothetical protein